MNDLIPLSFEGAPVRVLTIDGEPWLVAADVCRVLGLPVGKGVWKHLRRLGSDEMRRVTHDQIVGKGTGLGVTALSESGLYKLVLRSDKPQAGRFQDWVTKEVLPSIRKDGQYVTPGAPSVTQTIARYEVMLRAVLEHQERMAVEFADLRERIDTLQLAADGRVAALEYVSVRELLDEAKALPKGRRSLQGVIFVELRSLAATARPAVSLRRSPHGSRPWLFPREFADRYMAGRGKELVADHNANAAGQGLRNFAAERKKRRGQVVVHHNQEEPKGN